MDPGARRRLRRALLSWYDRESRELPWRRRGGPQEPYRVLLSETMLQQTRAAVVAARYEEFVRRWPTAEDFAPRRGEPGAGCLGRPWLLRPGPGACTGPCARWQGRGSGAWPETAQALARLPGAGPYTAAAVAAIAFEAPVVPVDGNVRRVAARLFALGGGRGVLQAATWPRSPRRAPPATGTSPKR